MGESIAERVLFLTGLSHTQIQVPWLMEFFKNLSLDLAGDAVGWSIVPYTEVLWGSIPGQGTYLGYRFNPWSGSLLGISD